MADNPCDNALAHFVLRNESIRNLDIELSQAEIITQRLLKNALDTIIQAYIDLEFKHNTLLLLTEEAKDKAQLALDTSGTVIEMGKLMQASLHQKVPA